MFWGAAGYAGSVPRKVFPGILVCLLVEQLISLGASLGVLFLTVLLSAERVHGWDTAAGFAGLSHGL